MQGFPSPFLGEFYPIAPPQTIFSARTTHPFTEVHAHALKRDI
jgi:ubiquitin-protein ligase